MRLAVAKHVGEDVEPSEANRAARADIAASFQRVAVLHLEQRTRRAIQWTRAAYPELSALVVAGGVASNLVVRVRVSKGQGAGLHCGLGKGLEALTIREDLT